MAVQTFAPLALVAKTGRAMLEATDEGDDAAFDHRERVPRVPAAFANQGDWGRGRWGEGKYQCRATRDAESGHKEIKGLGVGVRDALGIGGGLAAEAVSRQVGSRNGGGVRSGA